MSSKKLEQHRARQDALSRLGKELVRRSKSHCELCAAQHVPLKPWEVAPIADEPVLEHTLLLCDTCREQLDNPKRRDANHWHCLNTSAWSSEPAVQVTAVRLLRELGEDWCEELLGQLYLSPEAESWLTE